MRRKIPIFSIFIVVRYCMNSALSKSNFFSIISILISKISQAIINKIFMSSIIINSDNVMWK